MPGARREGVPQVGHAEVIEVAPGARHARMAEQAAKGLNTRAVAFIPHGVGVAGGVRDGRALEQLEAKLSRSHPGAAASLREGMAETLTLTRLGITGPLTRTLALAIERDIASPMTIKEVVISARQRNTSSSLAAGVM